MYVSLNRDSRTELRVCPKISPGYRIEVKDTVSVIKEDFAQTELHLQQGQKQELLWVGGSANRFESSTGQNIACIFYKIPLHLNYLPNDGI